MALYKSWLLSSFHFSLQSQCFKRKDQETETKTNKRRPVLKRRVLLWITEKISVTYSSVGQHAVVSFLDYNSRNRHKNSLYFLPVNSAFPVPELARSCVSSLCLQLWQWTVLDSFEHDQCWVRVQGLAVPWLLSLV